MGVRVHMSTQRCGNELWGGVARHLSKVSSRRLQSPNNNVSDGWMDGCMDVDLDPTSAATLKVIHSLCSIIKSIFFSLNVFLHSARRQTGKTSKPLLCHACFFFFLKISLPLTRLSKNKQKQLQHQGPG